MNSTAAFTWIWDEIVRRANSQKYRRSVLGFVGPFLLVLTFLEDSLRTLFNWNEHTQYMQTIMKNGRIWSALCLLLSVSIQLISSICILRPKSIRPCRIREACYALSFIVLVQPFLFGQERDLDFVCRSIALLGGLMLLVWSENNREWRSEDMEIPKISPINGDKLQLLGRFLLTSLFFFHAICGKNGGLHSVFAQPSILNVLSTTMLLSLSVLVCVGFRTEWSALFLTVGLGLANVVVYPYWNVSNRLTGFYRYNFYQTISIMGGLTLLALHGPGKLSIDSTQRKKI
jgi:ER-derived vesicles protein